MTHVDLLAAAKCGLNLESTGMLVSLCLVQLDTELTDLLCRDVCVPQDYFEEWQAMIAKSKMLSGIILVYPCQLSPLHIHCMAYLQMTR